jgi:hypothetical protein
MLPQNDFNVPGISVEVSSVHIAFISMSFIGSKSIFLNLRVSRYAKQRRYHLWNNAVLEA